MKHRAPASDTRTTSRAAARVVGQCRTAPVVEALQPRTLLSVTPAMAARLEGAGYERMTWGGSEVFAEPGEWLVSVKGMRGSAARQLSEAATRLRKLGKGIDVVRQLGHDGLFKITAPPSLSGDLLRAALRRVRNFEFVEPNAAVWAQGVFDERDDTNYPSQYGLNNLGAAGTVDADIDAPEAWASIAGEASAVVVGVIDTGVDYRHVDLAANMWVNPNEVAGDGIDNDDNGYVDDVHGVDFTDGDGDPIDGHGHGTHVAGIIAAVANNTAGISGVAPNARVMSLRIFDHQGLGSTDGAVAALHYAADMKARGVNIRVTNNSWGGPQTTAALDRAIRENGEAGILFVAAAGNGGEDFIGDNNDVAPFYPASSAAPNVLSVTATDSRDLLGSLSNFGPTSVDLAAPGMIILSTVPNGDYHYLSGTSLASPHVVGVAAMAFGMHPGATPADVRTALIAGVDPIPALSGKVASGGRLNALATLRAMESTAVVGRHVFYNASAFDGRTAEAAPDDDGAIATDKIALLPGQPARFANYTSYSKGINGVMVDVRGAAGTIGGADVTFAVRTAAGDFVPAPAPTGILLREGEGLGGSDRLTITWADGAIRDTWLRVTVIANAATGLRDPDVFYFGNTVGETGNSATDAAVTGVDFSLTRAAQRPGAVPVTNLYDFNRDGVINAIDLLAVRGHQTMPGLPLITAPSSLVATQPASAPTVAPVFSTAAVTPQRRVTTRIGAYLESW